MLLEGLKKIWNFVNFYFVEIIFFVFQVYSHDSTRGCEDDPASPVWRRQPEPNDSQRKAGHPQDPPEIPD